MAQYFWKALAPVALPVSQWPDATNTGWAPTGVTLAAHPASLVVTTPGTVIDSLDFGDQLKIDAANVTVKRCRLKFPGAIQLWLTANAKNCTIQDTEINGMGTGGGNGILSGSNGVGNGSTYLRCNIWNVENGIDPGDGDLIQDNYIHDLMSDGSPHYDVIQINGGDTITLRHNTFENQFSFTSNVNLSNVAPIANIVIDHNQFLGASLQVQFLMDGRFSASSCVATLTNNVMQLASGQAYDFVSPGSASPFSFTHSGNVDYVTGANIDGLL